jgi:predicted ATPase
MLGSETALSELRGTLPEADAVRHILSAWRFYHGFRTDSDSPLRRPGLAVTAPTLDADGGNLGAVFATLKHIRGDTTDLDAAVDQAFPGARLQIPMPERNASFAMVFPEVPHHPFGQAELSDGTLQFLALLGALLAYRLPPFIALNEPEASLHPDLLPALARAMGKAAERSQVWSSLIPKSLPTPSPRKRASCRAPLSAATARPGSKASPRSAFSRGVTEPPHRGNVSPDVAIRISKEIQQ